MKINIPEFSIPVPDIGKAINKSLDHFEITIGIIFILTTLGYFGLRNLPAYIQHLYNEGYYNMAPMDIAKPSSNDIAEIIYHSPGGR